MHRRRTGSIARRSTDRGPRARRSVVTLVTMGLLGALTVGLSATVAPVAPAAAAPAAESAAATGLSVPNRISSSTSIAAGGKHTCALTSVGGVRCWGLNNYGQLGNGASPNRSEVPSQATGLASGYTSVVAGQDFACALSAAGGVKCWGRNQRGQLGTGSTTNQSVPVDVPGVSGVTAIAAGLQTACAVTTGGGVQCWGEGYGTSAIDVPGLSGVTAVELGGSLTVDENRNAYALWYVCAITSAGTAKCWGHNEYGQLGNGSTNLTSTPVAVSGLAAGVVAITAGARHTCAILHDRTAACWGRNKSGLLGNGGTTNSLVPVPVAGLTGVTSISAGETQTCATTADGAAWCWGHFFNFDHLETCSRGNTVPPPSCWFRDSSYFGKHETVPVPVPGMSSGRTAVSVGENSDDSGRYSKWDVHACALDSSGGVGCWGYNDQGQLGNNDADGGCCNDPVGVAVSPLDRLVGNVLGPAAATASVSTTTDEATVFVGAPIRYHVAIRPTGTTALSNVAVSMPGATCGDPVNKIVLNAVATVDCTHVATLADRGTYRSTASIVTFQNATPVLAPPFDVAVYGPSVSLTVTSDQTQVGTGEGLSVNFTLANTGNVGLSNLVVDMPGFSNCRPTVASLSIGASTTVGCSYVPQASDVGEFPITATVTSSELTVPVRSNTLVVEVTPPGMRVTAVPEESGVVLTGSTIHYRVTVRNTSPVTLHHVLVTMDGPSCPVLQSDDRIGIGATLQPGELVSTVCTVVPTVLSVGPYQPRASATATEVTTPVRSAKTNLTVESDHPVPSALVTMTADESAVVVGDTIHYRLSVMNTGSTLLNNVVIDAPNADCVGEGVPIAVLTVIESKFWDCTHVTGPEDVGTYRNIVSLAADEFTSPRSSNRVEVQVAPPRVPTFTAASSIDGSRDHFCGVTTAGGVKCWGHGSAGQLGNGTQNDASAPVDVTGLASGVVDVATGANHSCALSEAGAVSCWGSNQAGEMGSGATTPPFALVPIAVPSLQSGVIAIEASGTSTCALTAAGVLKCWAVYPNGTNQPPALDPTTVHSLGVGATDFVGSGNAGCALVSGAVKCWTSQSQQGPSVPTVVAGLGSGVTALDGFDGDFGNNLCAATAGGVVRCWQLGDAPEVSATLGQEVTDLAVGDRHTCALLADATVWCWGYGNRGQLGNGSHGQSVYEPNPVPVTGLGSGARALSAQGDYTCALAAAGAMQCWGFDGSYHVLGQGAASFPDSDSLSGYGIAVVPVTVTGGFAYGPLVPAPGLTVSKTTTEPEVVVGDTIHSRVTVTNTGNVALNDVTVIEPGGVCPDSPVATIGVGANASVDCTRRARTADVGTLTTSATASSAEVEAAVPSNSTSVTVVAPSTFVQPFGAIDVSDTHSCAVTAERTVVCWGDVPADSDRSPHAVSGLNTAVTAVVVGTGFTCVLTAAGAVKCWGLDPSGPGRGSSVPADVDGLSSGVVAISAGVTHACAVTTAGELKCWGYGADLGDGGSSSGPIHTVAGLTDVVSVSAGASHTCAVTEPGALYCWGYNGYGQLGDGTINSAPTPVAVPGMDTGVTAAAAGAQHTCALSDDGGVSCWGDGSLGQIGSSASTSPTPVEVPELDSGVTHLAIGTTHSCALTDEGAVQCWGRLAGMLGDPDSPSTPTPTTVPGLESGMTALAATETHSCALSAGGAIFCWGDNGDHGRLGVETIDPIPGLARVAVEQPFGPPSPSGTVEATALQTSVVVGDTVHYRVVLENTGNVTLTNVSLSGPGTTCAPHAESVDAGGSMVVACTHEAVLDDVGTYPTTFTVTADELDDSVAADPVNVEVSPVPDPSMTVATSADQVSVVPGQAIDYHVTVANTGNVPLTGVTVSDVRAPACAGPVADIPVGSSTTVDCSYVTTGANQGTYPNTAVGRSDQTDAVTSNTVNVAVGAAFTALLTRDEAAVVATNPIHYHLTIANTSQLTLTGFTISDPNATDCEGQTVPDLAPGTQHTVDCAYTPTNANAGPYFNEVSVDTAQTSPVSSNDVSTTVTAANPAVTVTQSADESAVLTGATVHYHFAIRNSGNVTLHQVTVGGTTSTCSAPVATLAPGADVTIDCTHVAVAGDIGTYTNTGSVTATEITSPVSANSVGVTVTAAPAPAFTVVKSADQASVVAGQPIDYHVVVTNTGNVPLTGIAVTDAHAPDCDGPVPDLAVGAAHTVDCSYTTVAPADVGTYSNTASVDSAQTSPQDSNTVEVTVAAQAPAVTITQTADESTVAAGEAIHYHLVVHNSGNVALSGLAITDPAAPACAGPVADLAAGASATVHCTYTTTGGDVGTFSNPAWVTSAEVTTPVASNTVAVDVTVPPGSGHVAGTVTQTGAGTPVVGAVAVLLSPADFSPVAVATTDAAGHFSALAVPGSYFVYVLDPTGGHVAGFHGAPSQVTATAGITTTADTGLAPNRGSIGGAVTADSGGAPLAGVIAMSIDLENGRPAAGDLTDANGAYTISGLTPGPRLMEFVDLSGGHRPEFFDDAPTPAGSSIISVVGANVTTADAALATQSVPAGGAHLVGEITSTTGGDLEGVAVMAVHTPDFSFAAGDLTDPAGHYDIDLEAGDYKLAFYDPSGTHRFEWFDNQSPDGLANAATVTATAGTPLDTDAALTPTTGTATGTVTDSGSGDPLGDVAVFAIDLTGTVVGVAHTNPDGTYTVIGLPPGNLRLRYIDLTGTHASEYYDNSPGYDTATQITSTAGTTTPNVNAALTPTG